MNPSIYGIESWIGSSATSLTRAGSPTGSASSGVSQPLAGRIQPSTPKAKLAVDILVVTPESNVGVINGKKLYSSRKKTVAGSAKKLLTTTTTPVSLPPGLSTTIIPPSPSIDPLLAPEYSHNPAGPASSSATNFKCPQCDKIYKGKHARSIWRRHLQDKHGIPLSSQPRRTRWDNGTFLHLSNLFRLSRADICFTNDVQMRIDPRTR